MGIRHNFKSAFREILAGENQKWNRGWRRIVLDGFRYFEHVVREFARDRCFLRAAALTFTTLLTLIPILVLFFIVFRAFGGLNALQNQLESFLFKHLLPESVTSIRQYIQALVTGFNSTAVSTVSILFLILSAYGLFASIDSSMNTIWKVHVSRRFITRLVHLWFILTILPLFLGYSLYLSAKLLKYPVTQGGMAVHLVDGVIWIAPVIITWLIFTVIYKYVPQTSVHWRPALIGGFVAAVLWEVSKHGFNYYVKTFVNLKLLYGSFLILPLFLIWVDVTWIIILGGAELAYTYQNMKHLLTVRAMEKERRRLGGVVSFERTALLIMVLAARAYATGEAFKTDHLKKHILVPENVLRACIDRLKADRLLIVSDEGYIVPGKPIESISAWDIISCFKVEPATAGLPAADRLWIYYNDDLKSVFERETLSEILERTFLQEN